MLEEAKDRRLHAVMRDRGLFLAVRIPAAVPIISFLAAVLAPVIDLFATAIWPAPRGARRAVDQLAQAGRLTILDKPKRGDSPCFVPTKRSAVLPFPSGNPHFDQGPNA